MATPFKDIKCFIDNCGNKVISWRFKKLIPYNKNARLFVEYSTLGDTWLKISPDVKDTFFFIDTQHKSINKVDLCCYRLVYKVNSTLQYISKVIPSDFHLNKKLYAILKNLYRLAYKLMTLTGRTGLLLKKKTYGLPCPACKHFADDQSVNLHCTQCFGTGIKDGFYLGIPLPILPEQTQQVFGTMPQGYQQGRIMQARTPAWAYIQSGDIWVDDYTNQRYNIDQIQIAASFKYIPTVYSLTMHLILDTDVIHSEQIDLKLAPSAVNDAWLLEFKVL